MRLGREDPEMCPQPFSEGSPSPRVVLEPGEALIPAQVLGSLCLDSPGARPRGVTTGHWAPGYSLRTWGCTQEDPSEQEMIPATRSQLANNLEQHASRPWPPSPVASPDYLP